MNESGPEHEPGELPENQQNPEQAEILEEQPETAPQSPLPAIKFKRFNPETDNHNILEDESVQTHWLAMLDFDNTLYEAEPKHSIILHSFARFLEDKWTEPPSSDERHNFDQEGGSLEALEGLISYCDKWADQREKRAQKLDKLIRSDEVIGYEEGIETTGLMSAGAFKGMSIAKLKAYGREFVETHLKGRLFDYTSPTIQKLKDHGILPVMVTGAPDFLVPFLLAEVDINHGNGMTYKLDESGRLTGEIDVNLGLGTEKGSMGDRYAEKGHAIAISAGDSVGDSGSFSCAVYRDQQKWDIIGAALMVNADEDALAEVSRHHGRVMDGKRKRLRRVKKMPDTIEVLNELGLALRSVFEPMHEYGSLIRDKAHPEKLEAFKSKQRAMLKREEKHPNIENIKRIRDMWERKGLRKDQIRKIMVRFYPEIIVDDALKRDTINTRISVDIQDWLKQIGASRDTIEEVLGKNELYHEERGTLIRPMKRRSSVPPAPIGDQESES